MRKSEDIATGEDAEETPPAKPKSPSKLLVWRTLRTALGVTFRNPGRLLLIGVISQAAMTAMFILFGWPLLLNVTKPVVSIQGGQFTVDMMTNLRIALPGNLPHLLSQLLALVSFAFAYSAVSIAVHNTMDRRASIDLRSSLQGGLRALIPASIALVILYLLYLLLSMVVFAVSYGLSVDISDKVLVEQLTSALGAFSGFVLIYAGIGTVAAIPAISVEGVGALAGLGRSMGLTNGNRLRVIGIAAVCYIVYFILLAIFQMAALSLMRQASVVDTSFGHAVYWVLFPLFVVSVTTFFLVLGTVIYRSLVQGSTSVVEVAG